MKRGLVMCAIGVVAIALQAQDTKDPDADRVQRVAEKEGVQLLFEARAGEGAGGPYYCTIKIANGRDQALGINQSGRYRVLDEISMTNSAGEPVAPTRFGAKRLGSVGGRGSTQQLAKGDAYTMSYNLTRLFDMSEAGEYRLLIRKRLLLGPKNVIELELKDVPLKVREPTADDLERWGQR
jgi:hypothetical protein